MARKSDNYVDHEARNPGTVSQMFSRIAPRYDLLNHLLSLGLDIRWRKKVAEETGRVRCEKILDVCTGSGDMAIELCRFWKGRVRVHGVDFSPRLLEIAEQKSRQAGLNDRLTFREADAEQLPYGDEEFNAVTITFGLRNINNRHKALQEFYRVTRPGGCFVCLEFSQPVNAFFRKVYFFYLMKFVPFFSLLVGSDSGAYRYLGETIKDFPTPHELSTTIESAGWKHVDYRRLAGGIVAIHRGKKGRKVG
ncbi:MAG: bifunctional demethylmenaquinone methyltransferase/2-methoxy-6-polyprenyl-1,4-benzoquinol methylase UbiE [Nitrospirota bacterium]